jgi:hypothetical protein
VLELADVVAQHPMPCPVRRRGSRRAVAEEQRACRSQLEPGFLPGSGTETQRRPGREVQDPGSSVGGARTGGGCPATASSMAFRSASITP